MSRYCPNEKCRDHQLQFETFKFCTACGTKMVEKKPCECGYKASNFKYCPECGKLNT